MTTIQLVVKAMRSSAKRFYYEHGYWPALMFVSEDIGVIISKHPEIKFGSWVVCDPGLEYMSVYTRRIP